MLTKEELENNKHRFKDLVCNITRLNDEEVAKILNWLDSSDFFTAPASTKYHGAYEGGLCEHSLHVYDNLYKLYNTFHFSLDDYDVDSICIVALFHDLGKVNFYKQEIKHRKVYDNTGKSFWEDYTGYSIRDNKDRFTVGNHEENCVYLVSTLIPLRPSEYAAILNHHGGMGWDSAKAGTPEVFQTYPLAQFLHYADCIDAYDSTTRNSIS